MARVSELGMSIGHTRLASCSCDSGAVFFFLLLILGVSWEITRYPGWYSAMVALLECRNILSCPRRFAVKWYTAAVSKNGRQQVITRSLW